MFRLSRLFFLSICVLMLTITVVSQDDTCSIIIQTALETVTDLCADSGRNQACYGNLALTAAARAGVADFQFNQPGNIVNVTDIASLTLGGMAACVIYPFLLK